MNLLAQLQLQKLAAAAPAAAPAPPPNAVKAPAVVVQHQGSGPGAGSVPTVPASGTPDSRGLHAAQPLTAGAGAGTTEIYEGQLRTPEEIAMMEEQKRLQAEEAAKNAPKQQAALKPERKGTDLSTSLLKSWETRLGKLASDPGFQPARTYDHMPQYGMGPPKTTGPTAFDINAPGGIVGGYSTPKPSTPFKPGSGWDQAYGYMRNFMLSSMLGAVKPRGPLEASMSQNPTSVWNQNFARHSAELQNGPADNPMLALAGNALGSILGGNGNDRLQQVGQQFNI